MTSAVKLRANNADWNFNPYAFQYDMTVYLALSSVDEKSITNTSDYQIAAFYDDECRGLAEEKVIDGHRYVYLRIRSNKTEGETIQLKVRNTTTGKIAKVEETIDFKSQETIGYPSSPFSINARNPYSVTFVINGVEKRSELFYGDEITPPTDTNKEGYTFVKWDPIVDSIVPDHDVTYTASYNVNYYKLTYIIDDEIYKEFDVAFGETIIPLAIKPIEGKTFEGWTDVPSTMPSHDVTIYGKYVSTSIKNTPLLSNQPVSVYNINGILVKKNTDFKTINTILDSGIYIVNGKKIRIK